MPNKTKEKGMELKKILNSFVVRMTQNEKNKVNHGKVFGEIYDDTFKEIINLFQSDREELAREVEEKLYEIMEPLKCLNCDKTFKACKECDWDSIYDEILSLIRKETR